MTDFHIKPPTVKTKEEIPEIVRRRNEKREARRQVLDRVERQRMQSGKMPRKTPQIIRTVSR